MNFFLNWWPSFGETDHLKFPDIYLIFWLGMDSLRGTQMGLLLLFIIMLMDSKVKGIDGLTTSPAAAAAAVRVDPLDKFKIYRGGFNITNKHYWSSAIFTGVYGYGIGVLWLLSGALYGCFIVSTTCCKRSNKRKLKRRSVGYKQSYILLVLLATFFTILAIVASGLVIGGNAKFHSEANSVVKIIIKTANEASKTILNTTEAMTVLKNNLEENDGGSKVSLLLTSTSERLRTEATDIEIQARKHGRFIDKGLKIVYITTSVTLSLCLIAAVALPVNGIMRHPRARNSLIVLCWFLTFLCWFFFGLYLSLERFSADACTALESFKENPNNNSLSSILPCNELLSAKPLLSQVCFGVYNFINEVKASSSLPATFMPTIVSVCNPFSAPPECQYQPKNCPAHSIRIGDIPKALKNLTCSDDNNGTCQGEFKLVEAFSNSIQELLNVYPGMEGLVECQPVKDAFTEILTKHCRPLKRHVKLVWEGMVFLSVVMVFLVLTWMAKAHHEQQQELSDGNSKGFESQFSFFS